MAKVQQAITTEKKDTQKFPSDYGSHKSMKDDFLSSFLPEQTAFIVLRDANGPYLTELKRLDNKMSDPYRYTSAEFRTNLLKDNGVDANAKPD
ncbi:MAG: hypothetical protein WC375_00165 [Methanomassiliicoccales archaeon]|jgi:hypothetical protein